MLFIGDDWAQDHHDIELEDDTGRRLARARFPEGMEGIAKLHALIAEHAPTEWVDLPADQVVVGIETDRGPWVVALQAAGYLVFAINPLSAARYRQRHSTSGAKSDAGDAHVLAEIVRVDRAHHRQIAGDSDLADAVKLLTRAHPRSPRHRDRGRHRPNRRLGNALHQQAFSAISTSPGARAYYDTIRGRGVGHHAALRQLANRLVGVLHGCLKTGTQYDEATAWQHRVGDTKSTIITAVA
ncbi:IS110 family transposase (plasmid) [Rhodococcus globerulus]|uniref:IS110 family transposase n=1 Tax=Rhodococcus globerulus TaxID=33008 RepID=UPI0039ED0069